jgi:hypothetical protein
MHFRSKDRLANSRVKEASKEDGCGLLNLLDLDGTTQETCPASGDETNFLSGDGVAVDCGGFSDML